MTRCTASGQIDTWDYLAQSLTSSKLRLEPVTPTQWLTHEEKCVKRALTVEQIRAESCVKRFNQDRKQQGRREGSRYHWDLIFLPRVQHWISRLISLRPIKRWSWNLQRTGTSTQQVFRRKKPVWTKSHGSITVRVICAQSTEKFPPRCGSRAIRDS